MKLVTLKIEFVQFPSNDWSYKMRLTTSWASIVTTLFFVIAYSSAVFGRLIVVQQPFSYDYHSYLVIINALGDMSFSEMTFNNTFFPYVTTNGLGEFEFGFSLLVRLVMLLSGDAETAFAIIAALSVGLRVYTMERLGVPRIWILVLNVFAITLLEANALRLGVSSSILLFGLYQILYSDRKSGYAMTGIAATFHFQVIIFMLPFLVFFIFSSWITRSKVRVAFFLFASSIVSFAIAQVIPVLTNEKVVAYVALGASGSSGLTFTSAFAAIFLIFSALALDERSLENRGVKFWAAIVLASVPSVILLMFLTDVAVIGDRAWQLAFLVLATFFFSRGAVIGNKIIPLVFLLALTFTSIINITVRYPLSNFFSPPFPHIEVARRF
jgi:hypothetical protein